MMRKILSFIEAHMLYSQGCGFIDLSLLASTILEKEAKNIEYERSGYHN